MAGNPGLQGNPAALLTKLKTSARTGMQNGTGPNNPNDYGPSATSGPCLTGWCHLQYYNGSAGNPITFSDAYGAGIVDAEAASH